MYGLRSSRIAFAEEVILSVYEDLLVAKIRQLNKHAGIPLDRIVEGIAMKDEQPQ